jgi:glycosyltransferase involved in cell wall biosynthesis
MSHIVMVHLGDIRYDGRVRKEIQTLALAGHGIELVTSDFKGDASAGEDLGIPVHYVPITLSSHPVMNFLSQLWFNKEAASIICRLGPSHIHCHDLSTLLAGVWAKKNTGAELIFDAHELMPESMGGVREAVWGRIEKKCIDWCDQIIMPEKNRIVYFKKKYPRLGEVLLLENFPRQTDIPKQHHDLFRKIYPIGKDQKIVLHTGLIAAKRHVEELIDSMSLCGEEFVLVLLGRTFKGYKQSLNDRIKGAGLQQRVFLHDAVPNTKILSYMASGDIGTAFYSNTNINNYYCASNKLYEYIALKKPVLTNNYPGLLQSVESFKQGVCLETMTPENLVKGYVQACDSASIIPGNKKFYWEEREDVLIRLYQSKDRRTAGAAGSINSKEARRISGIHPFSPQELL